MNRSRFTVFLIGIAGALFVTILLIILIMRPDLDDLVYLTVFLSITGAASAGLGLLSHRWGWWRRLPSLRHAVVVGYVVAGVLTLFNVWVTAVLMFVNTHDLALAGLLLIFAVGIAAAFGYFLSGSITESLSRLSGAARRVSQGDFAARVEVEGEDEVARLAESFNMMAERLEKTAAEAERLDASRRNLVAWASHDLRTPLSSLRAMLDALADGVVSDPETTRRYLAQSRAEVTRMSRLIDDLFELAQLDADRYTLNCELSSLSDLISDTLAAFSARAEAQDIRLEGTVESGIDPVWIAPDKVSRVLYNLLENAVRHTPPGGRIALQAARQDAGCVVVTVEDTGEGISPESLPHIFDAFYRGEKSRSRDGYATGGAGLGLAIVKRLVEAHGGDIHAESERGRGTRITFTLPRQASGANGVLVLRGAE
jgi:two-component system sensor histidine kinase BaeS